MEKIMSVDKSEKDEEKTEKPIVAKSAVDLQRLKLQKLMKNPEKPVLLPERPKSKNTPTVPEFVRNVMGSSAGAGSGEFHVYRHLRRKEYSRRKFIQEKGHKELLDEEYHRKLEENRKLAEEITAKKRAKRLKRKMKQKEKKKQAKKPNSDQTKDTEEEDSDEDEDEDHASEEEIKDKNISSGMDVDTEDRKTSNSENRFEGTQVDESQNKGNEEDLRERASSGSKENLGNEDKINVNKNGEDSDEKGRMKSETTTLIENSVRSNDVEESSKESQSR